MTQEDKDLLLKDLCARLPYGVRVYYNDYNSDYEIESIKVISYSDYKTGSIHLDMIDSTKIVVIDEIKPYLFPLSSMTEEQKVEFDKMAELDIEYTITQIKNDAPNWTSGLNRFNWLLKNHFDVYGLIPMSLALDATGLNVY